MEKRNWFRRIWMDGDKRWALIATVVYVALAIGTTAYRAAPGIYVGEQFLKKKSDALIESGDGRIAMTRGDNEADFTYAFYDAERTAHMTVTPEVTADDYRANEQVRVDFSDGMSVDATWQGDRLVDEEGFPLDLGMGMHIEYAADSYYPGKPEITGALYRLYKSDFESRDAWQTVFLSVFLFAVAGLSWLWPEKVALFGHRWRFKGEPELSDDGLFMEKIGAVVMAALAVVFLFVPV